MNNIKFSIIMPTYNRAHCINEAIQSVLKQTYQEYELIIVDDNSSDETEKLITTQYKNDISKKKIRYFKLNQHQGVSKARNRGLTEAQYSWICYLDTDNTLDKVFLETYKDLIEKHPENKCFYTQVQHKKSQKIFGAEFNYQQLCQANYIDLGVFVHHKSLYETLGGFDNKLTRLVDWDLILRYTKQNTPIYSPTLTMYYNDDETAIRITNTENFRKNYKLICKKNKLKQPQKEFTMKLALLKLMRITHLLNKKKYNDKRYVELVNASPLFDTKWYLANNPDVKSRKMSAAKHYVKYGWKEGRNPSPKFDGNQYLADYPDVMANTMCPLAHYLVCGAKEGRCYNSVTGEMTCPNVDELGLLGKLRYALEYPLRLQEECDRLKNEIKELKQI